MTTAVQSLEIGNWDVLVEPMPTDNSIFRLYQQKNHVGNNRFEVLLNMHRSEFDDTLVAGMDTAPVVSKIINIVNEQCLPKGRFLCLDSKGGWKELPEEDAREFVQEWIITSTPEDPADEVPPMDSKRRDSNYAHLTEDDESGNKKRGRRSSLLRRSFSESMISTEKFTEDRKKAIRPTLPSINSVRAS